MIRTFRALSPSPSAASASSSKGSNSSSLMARAISMMRGMGPIRV